MSKKLRKEWEKTAEGRKKLEESERRNKARGEAMKNVRYDKKGNIYEDDLKAFREWNALDRMKEKQGESSKSSKKSSKNTIDLSAQRDKQKESIKADTRFKDTQQLVPGLTGKEFGDKKRELFAEERPTEKKILDFASQGAIGLLAGEALAGGVGVPASSIRGGEAGINALTKTVRSGKGGILGKFKTAIPGQITAQTGANSALNTAFQVNSKSQGLTNSFLGKIGLTIPSASILLGAIGSYPFAGFIKEEALQTLGFATKTALDNGDLEGAQKSIDETAEALNPSAWEKLIGSVPYANVVKQLRDFYKAAATKVEADQTALDKLRAVQSGEIESDFTEERRLSDEAATQRKIEQQGLDAEYYRLIREGKFEEAEEFRISRLE